MTNLRPGLGSCTPNWGIHDDRNLRDCLLRLDLLVSLRHTSDPNHGWIGPRPVTEESPSNPKESVLDCTNITWATKKRLLRSDDRVKTN